MKGDNRMNKTKFLALVLVLAMVLTFGVAGCGDTAAVSSAPAASAEAAEETTAPTAAAPTENVVALDSSEEGTAGQTVAVTVADPHGGHG